MKKMEAFVEGTMVGAALAFLGDPVVGRRHRALVRDAAVRGSKILGRAIRVSSRDVVHRAQGILERVKDVFESDEVDDAVLTDRVRTAVGRVCSHPNVEVIVEARSVMLQGPVVTRERRAILKTARSVKGVCGVMDRMEPYVPLPTMPTQAMKERQPDIMQRHWAPATRVFTAAIGACMSMAGLKSGTIRGAASAAAGLGLLLRAATNMELKRLLRPPSGNHRRVSGPECIRL